MGAQPQVGADAIGATEEVAQGGGRPEAQELGVPYSHGAALDSRVTHTAPMPLRSKRMRLGRRRK